MSKINYLNEIIVKTIDDSTNLPKETQTQLEAIVHL
jgi:hypothetical protein